MIAGVFYYFGLSNDALTGFLLLGGAFELVAWKNVLRGFKDKDPD